MEKYYRAGQATDNNMAHVHYMLDTYGYKHTLSICNTYCFSTATTVARKRINVTCTLPAFLFLTVISLQNSYILCYSPTFLRSLCHS